MDSAASHVGSSIELRSQIERTRAALGEKLTALNTEVRGTVTGASEEVMRSLNHARQVVNPQFQFHQHPWIFCGAAFVLGVLMEHRRSRRGAATAARAGGSSLEDRASPPPRPPGLAARTLIPILVDILRDQLRRPRQGEQVP